MLCVNDNSTILKKVSMKTEGNKMKTLLRITSWLLLITLFGIVPSALAEKDISSKSIKSLTTPQPQKVEELNISGPRIGFTLIPDTEKIEDFLDRESVPSILTLFGWHWEYITRPETGGSSLLVQSLFLIGGLDQGLILPSYTGIVGLRTSDNVEIGVGPNLTPAGGALIIAFGKTFNYDGIMIPVNVAFVMNRENPRISLVTGFALRSSKR
jgi:hypothetical protein